MPICCVCQADGVLEACGAWYCMDHLEDGFIEVAMLIARVRMLDEMDVEVMARGFTHDVFE